MLYHIIKYQGLDHAALIIPRTINCGRALVCECNAQTMGWHCSGCRSRIDNALVFVGATAIISVHYWWQIQLAILLNILIPT